MSRILVEKYNQHETVSWNPAQNQKHSVQILTEIEDYAKALVRRDNIDFL